MTRPRLGPVVGVVVGLPLLLFGIGGMLYDADRSHPMDAFAWIVGSAVVNDLVFLPLVAGVGLLLARGLPSWARGAVRVGMALSAVLVVVAWPEIAGYGEDPTIPSLLPRDELAGLVVYLGLVWSAVAVWLVGRRWVRVGQASQQPPAG